MPTNAGTSRPLLFINSDQQSHCALPHRRAIYQHIQLKYVKWKRIEDARKMRTSLKKPQALPDDDESFDLSSQPSSSVRAVRISPFATSSLTHLQEVRGAQAVSFSFDDKVQTPVQHREATK